MKDAYKDLLFTPAQAGSAHLDWAESIHNNEGTTWGIPAIDRRVIPERPGEMICFIARPGHGKSSALAFRADHEARLIRAANKEGKRKGDIVLYITVF